jgi:hypothetical protein
MIAPSVIDSSRIADAQEAVAYLLAIYFCSVVLSWPYGVDGAAGVGVALVGDRLSNTWLLSRESRFSRLAECQQ